MSYNATDLSEAVKSLGGTIIATIVPSVVALVGTLTAAIVTYIRNNTAKLQEQVRQHAEMKVLKEKQVCLHEENNKLRATPRSGSGNGSSGSPH